MKKSIVFVPVVTSFITAFMGSALIPAIPSIGNQFHISTGAAGWTITVYMAACALLTLPFGYLADKFSRNMILVIGIGVFAVSSLAGGFSAGFFVLLGIRLLQGVGASMIFATGLAILSDSAEEGKKGRLVGLHTAAMYTGLSLGPAAGGIINLHFGWKYIFLMTGMAASAVFLCALKLTSAGGRKKSIASQNSLKEFCRSRVVICGILAALISCCANYAVTYQLSLYMQQVLGFSSQKTGIILIAFPAAQAALSPWTGRISDQIIPQNLAAAGMAVTAAVMGVLAWFTGAEGIDAVWVIAAILIAGGTGCAVFASPNAKGVMSAVPPDGYGRTGALLSVMRSLGNTCSMILISVTDSMRLSFLILCGLCILGIYVAFQKKM